MSLPPDQRHRNRKTKGTGQKGATAQMNHGSGSKADKKRREFQRKHGRGKKGGS
jgi:hypothetical protein